MRYIYFTLGLIIFLPFLFCGILLFYPKADNETPVVAIIDSGIDYNHEDLRGQVIKGYDFYSWDDDPMDENGHGTHVAGIVHEVEPTAKLLSVRVIKNRSKNSYSSSFGIFYSIYKQADIINMSYGSKMKDPLTSIAVWIAKQRDIIMVAASGNEGWTDDIMYPAGYKSVLAIGTFDQEKKEIDKNSNLGKVDFLASGVNINSTGMGGGYDKKSGTSMASAYISGVAAYLTAKDGHIGKQEIVQTLREDAIPVSKNKKTFSYIDIERIKAKGSNEIFNWVGAYEEVTKSENIKVPFIIDNASKAEIVNLGSEKKEAIEVTKDEIVLENLKEGTNNYIINLYTKKGIIHKKEIRVIKDTEYPEADIQTRYIKGKKYYIISVQDWSAHKVEFGGQTMYFKLDGKYEKSPFIVEVEDGETEVVIEDYSKHQKKFLISQK